MDKEHWNMDNFEPFEKLIREWRESKELEYGEEEMEEGFNLAVSECADELESLIIILQAEQVVNKK